MATTLEITDLDDPRFHRYFTEFTETAWRLETLPSYSVAYEDEAFNAFLDGRFDTEHLKPWIEDVITPAVEQGRDIGRVHVVEHTGTVHEHTGQIQWGDYLRYEFEVYRHTKAAGEDIRLAVVDLGQWPAGVYLKGRDFWLFDEYGEKPVIMNMLYSPQGAFRKAVVTEHPSRPALDRAVRCKRAALCASRPFYP